MLLHFRWVLMTFRRLLTERKFLDLYVDLYVVGAHDKKRVDYEIILHATWYFILD